MSRLTPVYRKLKGHRNQAVRHLHRTHRHARRLLKKHDIDLDRVRDHAVKTASVSGLAATALAGPAYAHAALDMAEKGKTAPADSSNHQFLTKNAMQARQVHIPGGFQIVEAETTQTHAVVADPRTQFLDGVGQIVSDHKANMTADQEAAMEQLIQQAYGIPAKAELEGIRLNATYGVMAGEQHLPLYPGDTLDNHTSDPTRHLTGMVPGLPSWGYFAPNKASVTQKDIERERYYIAAQTFLAPGWKQNVEKYYKWFKYRKMVMVNPATGSAVVVVIGDAGPSPRLDRKWGGSNEVMHYLDLGRSRKGGIYGFFVDDPEDKIPLGPLTGDPVK